MKYIKDIFFLLLGYVIVIAFVQVDWLPTYDANSFTTWLMGAIVITGIILLCVWFVFRMMERYEKLKFKHAMRLQDNAPTPYPPVIPTEDAFNEDMDDALKRVADELFPIEPENEEDPQ